MQFFYKRSKVKVFVQFCHECVIFIPKMNKASLNNTNSFIRLSIKIDLNDIAKGISFAWILNLILSNSIPIPTRLLFYLVILVWSCKPKFLTNDKKPSNFIHLILPWYYHTCLFVIYYLKTHFVVTSSSKKYLFCNPISDIYTH